ncbi:DUF3261 domain-containing protein [Shewanella sp. Isolate11]|uniref:DUF3261 domain-containing protein n=1 Tax=Shewanella sp. Isolate11 TaxID=2908530 RepID=UPI0031F31AA8
MSKNLLLKALLILSIVALSGCAQQLTRQTCMSLASEVDYCLAPLLKNHLSQTQQVNLEVDDKRHQLMSQLELTPEQLTLVGLAPLGQALFTLTYDGEHLDSQQSILLGDEFRGEYLLGLLQLIYWPIEDVNRNLQGGQLTRQTCDAALCRTLYASDNTTAIIEIRYSQSSKWQAQIILTIAQAKLTLKITPIG